MPNSPPTLNLIGAGRVGQTLARLWHTQGVFTVQDVHTRSGASAQAACAFIGAGQACSDMGSLRAADVWMLAVPDAQIASVALALAHAQTASPTTNPVNASHAPIAFHCSGAQAADRLAPLAALGWACASAHCILSFASPSTALAQFAGTPCALEGAPSACARLEQAFATVGAQCFTVASQDKLLYHAGAVFATNFLPVLQQVAEDVWRASGVPAPLITQLRNRLLHNAADNICRLGPQVALTGPAARGDLNAIATQAAAVTAWDAPSGEAYRSLSALALRMAGHELLKK